MILLLFALAFPGELPGVDIGVNLPPGFEPSGAVWHAGFERLFVVHDEGMLASMAADGTDVQLWSVGADNEGVAVADPDTDLIYIGIEQPDTIIEYNIVTETQTRAFDLTPWMQSASSNAGLESLTFVSDATDPEGGVFIAGLEETGDLYRFRLPIASSPTSTVVTFLDSANPADGRRYISGSDYHRDTGMLYLAWNYSNHLRAVDPEPPYAVIEEWELPGYGQEGIAIDSCNLFVAEDSGGAYTVVNRYVFSDPPPSVYIYMDATNVTWSQDPDPRVTYDMHRPDGVEEHIRGSYSPHAGFGEYRVRSANPCGKGE